MRMGRWIPFIILGVIFPFIGKEGYLTHLAITMLIFSILASSLNLSPHLHRGSYLMI